MALPRSVIEKRAVKAGVKASKKRHHLITEQELLSLRVQVMPALPRVILLLVGISLFAACWFSWPSGSVEIRILETFFGILTFLCGVFGIRRTLSKLLDTTDVVGGPAELVGSVLELIGDAVSNIDL
ncbi:hypothetical protein JIN84_11870 [Luteolibacter yonseiensis]|uniref:Uncharacterized protein n=1 Tax=Luteolibacter yonseiensis TaxID=1144680 RepID=A0A934R5F3_9BACT|nr:hypothetical protein [Luteolibacter yonseiensis]MBK1816313.1 hypothetical protein [Luteolibacter yonseiensis]